MPADLAVSPPPAHNWWLAEIDGPERPETRVVVVASDRHPDGTRLQLDPGEAAEQIGEAAVCTAVIGPAGVSSLQLGPQLVPRTPPLWFAELDEQDEDPPAISVVAFTGAGQSPGTLLDETHLADVWVDSDDQLGAIRWFPETGEVHQVYVPPSLRRHGLGSALVAAAATLQLARDKPRLWGSGRRTQLGEEWRNARSWRDRTAELTELAEPMTPQ